MNPRTIAAVWAGKLAGGASRALGRGGGTAIAGVVAERIDPALVRELGRAAGAGAIAVTGTNGKTTTALMLARIARAAGLRPMHNSSGSNMMRGVAAMLVSEASLLATVPDAAQRLGIVEVDEASLPAVAEALRPRAVVFTNLFRDQLDRYGEVDAVAALWERMLGAAPPDMTVVLNADDPAVAHLARGARGRVLTYGIDDPAIGGPPVDHASDFRTCLDCGAELAYERAYYGHLGHWRCPSCGNARPAPDVRATRVVLGEDGTSIELALADGAMRIALPLAGAYNAYNALAATAGALALGLPRDAVVAALEPFTAAFGRQERFHVEGREVRVLLGKNPTGLNQVLRTIAAQAPANGATLLFFLNDRFADGRDVSWIWDADYELARPCARSALAAGTRAEDLALRLKYAGFGADVPVERETARALRRALDATPAGATLYVVPTYTAMLEVRELLARMAARDGHGPRHFWQTDADEGAGAPRAAG